MAVNYSTAVKDNRLQNIIDAVDSKTYQAGSGAGSAGQLVIGTSGLSGGTGVLATFALQNPCGTKSGAVLTISGVPINTTASATGTAALAELRNNAGTTIASGLTVGTSGADVIISTTAVSSGQTLTLNSATITHG